MVGYDKDKKDLSTYQYVIAGANAGIITRAFCQPLDVIKIKFQLQVEPIHRTSQVSTYRAVTQAVKTVYKEEGFRGLWAGHNSGQLLSITYGIVNFAAFEFLTSHFSTDRSAISHVIFGTVSGSLATVASFPFDVIRTRFVAQGSRKNSVQTYHTMAHGLVMLVRKEGFTAPFKGLSPTLLQAGPLAGITFVVHNLVTKQLNENEYLSRAKNTLNLSGNMIAGSVAGFVAKTVVYPFDLFRKRLQLQGFQNARKGFGENFFCSGLLNCIGVTLKKEGLLSLYKGFTPSVFKAAVTTGLHFTVYEETCRLFGRK